MLPADFRDEFDGSTLLIGPGAMVPVEAVDTALLQKGTPSDRHTTS